MQYALSLLALAASAVTALPQGVTQNIPPPSPAPAGCSPDYSGEFQITVVNVTSSPSKVKRQSQPLEITLSGGVLKDAQQRTGYIASNYQFQFDGPPQAGAIYTSGFSVCGNGSLALGGSAIFYQCYSGGFYNLYDRHWAAQCSPIYIEVIGGSGSGSGAAPPAPQASQIPDGQVQATPAPVGQIGDGQVQQSPMPVGQIGDGQIQMPQAPPVGQIGDGQVQATPVGQIGDGQVQATPAPAPVGQIGDGQIQQGGNVGQIPDGQVQASPVGQIGDGQVQATPVGQIGDGQVQATPAAPAPPVGQIGDGQIQASSAAPVGQIGDGQIQATSAAAPVGQIGDGQIQATSAAAPVGQIGDGQIQASTPVYQASVTSYAPPVQQTVNAAAGFAVELPAAVAGVFAAIALL